MENRTRYIMIATGGNSDTSSGKYQLSHEGLLKRAPKLNESAERLKRRTSYGRYR